MEVAETKHFLITADVYNIIFQVCENRAHLNDTTCPRVLFGFEEFEFSKECTEVAINFTGKKNIHPTIAIFLEDLHTN